MTLETERLKLIPLTLRQMTLWVENIKELEAELGCVYKAEPLESDFLEIIERQNQVIGQNERSYPWYSFWLMIRKCDGVVVGSADFKTAPDEKGEVEIGYGLGREFEHNGYMTEAIKVMCAWALKKAGVTHIIAETYLDNEASQRILKRCSFTETKRDQSVWWRL